MPCAAHHLCIQPGASVTVWCWGQLPSGMLGTGGCSGCRWVLCLLLTGACRTGCSARCRCVQPICRMPVLQHSCLCCLHGRAGACAAALVLLPAGLPRPCGAAGVGWSDPLRLVLQLCFDSGVYFSLYQPQRCWARRSMTSPVTCGPSVSSCTFCKSDGSLAVSLGSEGGMQLSSSSAGWWG